MVIINSNNIDIDSGMPLGEFLNSVLSDGIRSVGPFFTDADLKDVLSENPCLADLYAERVGDILKNPLNCSVKFGEKDYTGKELLEIYSNMDIYSMIRNQAASEPTLYDHVRSVSPNHASVYNLKFDDDYKCDLDQALSSGKMINNNTKIIISSPIKCDDRPLSNDTVIFNIVRQVESKALAKSKFKSSGC